jgi:hypothetical protein
LCRVVEEHLECHGRSDNLDHAALNRKNRRSIPIEWTATQCHSRLTELESKS